MRRKPLNAVDYLEGVTLEDSRRPAREYEPSVFPPEIEARVHAKVKAGLSRRVAEEVVNRELAEEAAK